MGGAEEIVVKRDCVTAELRGHERVASVYLPRNLKATYHTAHYSDAL